MWVEHEWVLTMVLKIKLVKELDKGLVPSFDRFFIGFVVLIDLILGLVLSSIGWTRRSGSIFKIVVLTH